MNRTRLLPLLLLATWTVCLLPGPAAQGQTISAKSPLSCEDVAERAQRATFTIRVPLHDQEAVDPESSGGPSQVHVCSAVSVGDGFLATHADIDPQAIVRITLPGGRQASAKLSVFDQYSGLSLLHATDLGEESAASALAPPDPPAPLRAGQEVVAAAAWGAEPAVISVGRIGGVARTLPGANLPPLVQCSLRTTETSAGGPLVNLRGQLVGVVVAASTADDKHGWTYAAPASHILRLKRSVAEGKVVIIPRRRPIAGMTLTAGEQAETVIVERVAPDGPADRAGLKEGDRIVAVDGILVRSVYQVVPRMMARQPGDKLRFQVAEGDDRKAVDIVLGGGIALSPDRIATVEAATLVNPRIEIKRSDGPWRRLDERVRASGSGPQRVREPDGEELLVKALDRYGDLIVRLREELQEKEAAQSRNEAQIRALQAELEQLKRETTRD